MSFAVVFPFLKMRNIKEISKQIFDTPAECTVGRRILVYGVLYNLFLEFSSYPVVNPRYVIPVCSPISPPFRLKRDVIVLVP